MSEISLQLVVHTLHLMIHLVRDYVFCQSMQTFLLNCFYTFENALKSYSYNIDSAVGFHGGLYCIYCVNDQVESNSICYHPNLYLKYQHQSFDSRLLVHSYMQL